MNSSTTIYDRLLSFNEDDDSMLKKMKLKGINCIKAFVTAAV